ncbi:MAG: hypothetical protein ACT4OM_04230 [Actinomycetota bacterium]
MDNSSGLPDYVADHFAYFVRSSPMTRLGQASFFVSGLILPVLMLLALPNLQGEKVIDSSIPLIAVAAMFSTLLVWHLSWIEIRRFRFRKEKPSSYARWFGRQRRRLGSTPFGQIGLLRLQMRYVFLGKEPSPRETLELTMRLVRSAA